MIPPLAALYAWPIVVMILYRRYDLTTALILSLIPAYLLLPVRVGVDFPVLPRFDKFSIPLLSALLFSFIALRQLSANRRKNMPLGVLPGVLPRDPIMLGLVVLFIGGAFLTPLTNSDTLRYGPKTLQGLRPYDAFSSAMVAGMSLLPLLLARKYLGHPDAHRRLLIIIAGCGILYAFLALIEIRLSPQLSNWVYGVSVRDWAQQKREGGFRPVIFLEHSLWLGIFLATATIAAFAVWRTKISQQHKRFMFGAGLLLVTVVLSKTLGALMITLVLLPVILMLNARQQMLAAAIIGGVVVTYPLLRSADLVPVDKVVGFAMKISPERAGSLQYRLNNEDILLEKAMQRPALGWGGWGRPRVYNEKGEDDSTTDGRWVISIGLGGFARYFAEFGLLTLPMILLALRKRRYEITLITSSLCIVLCANLVDLIPNAGLTMVTWLMAGALIGRLEMARVTDSDATALEPAGRRQQRYRRGPQPGLDTAAPATDRAEGPRYTRFATKSRKAGV